VGKKTRKCIFVNSPRARKKPEGYSVKYYEEFEKVIPKEIAFWLNLMILVTLQQYLDFVTKIYYCTLISDFYWPTMESS